MPNIKTFSVVSALVTSQFYKRSFEQEIVSNKTYSRECSGQRTFTTCRRVRMTSWASASPWFVQIGKMMQSTWKWPTVWNILIWKSEFFIMISFFLIVSSLIWILQGCQKLDRTRVHFIYILDSSNSSSFTFWTSQFTSSSRCNWTFISNGHSTGSWNDKHSSHFSTANEISVNATFFFM